MLLCLSLAIMQRGDRCYLVLSYASPGVCIRLMLSILKDINHGYNTVKDGCYPVLSYVMLYVNVMLWS